MRMHNVTHVLMIQRWISGHSIRNTCQYIHIHIFRMHIFISSYSYSLVFMVRGFSEQETLPHSYYYFYYQEFHVPQAFFILWCVNTGKCECLLCRVKLKTLMSRTVQAIITHVERPTRLSEYMKTHVFILLSRIIYSLHRQYLHTCVRSWR